MAIDEEREAGVFAENRSTFQSGSEILVDKDGLIGSVSPL